MKDGNAVVAANGTEERHNITECLVLFPHQVSGTHKTRLLTSPLMFGKIIGAKKWIDGQPVLWPPLASKGHPYTIDIWNNRYRRCCTCDKWFVHNPRSFLEQFANSTEGESEIASHTGTDVTGGSLSHIHLNCAFRNILAGKEYKTELYEETELDEGTRLHSDC